MAEADASQKGSDAGEAPDPITGQVLNGRFSILEPIGTGGMGKVYRAVQAPLDRMVAVKVLHPHYANNKDPGFVRRFVLEASLTSKLRHPNTVTVIDYGQTEDGIFYLAMELLEGETLAQLLQREGALPWSRALFIGAQICRSLREAHKLGVLHRDLKPGNVMLLEESDHDVVKVLDFGLVKSFMAEDEALADAAAANDPDQVGKITQAGMLLGSPQYMSPEQARGDSDPRSDVYSFGVLLYEMLTGRAPFIAKDYLDVIVKHLKEAPVAPSAAQPGLDLPPEVEAMVMRCLAKAPEERFQSMDELLDAIRMASGVGGLTESFQLSYARGTGAGLPALGRQPTPPPNLSVTGQLLPPRASRSTRGPPSSAPRSHRASPLAWPCWRCCWWPEAPATGTSSARSSRPRSKPPRRSPSRW